MNLIPLRALPDESSSTRIGVDIMLAEYKALRDEILKKMDNRTALTISSVTVSSAIIGFGVDRQSGALLLVAPLVSILLGILILHHNMQIAELAGYIKASIERPLTVKYPGSIGWHGGRDVFLVILKRRFLFYQLTLMLIAVVPILVTFPLAWTYQDSAALTIPLALVNVALLVVYALHIVRFRDRWR